MKAIEKWAADEFRSTNGQIEWMLRMDGCIEWMHGMDGCSG